MCPPRRASSSIRSRMLCGPLGTAPSAAGEASLRAFAEATELARQADASIYLVHIQHHDPSNRRLDKLEQLAATCFDIHSIITIERGNPAEKIVEEALRIEADYIYIGKNNFKESGQDLLGNISEEVVRISPIPVIIVES